jgi:hypothetical protein
MRPVLTEAELAAYLAAFPHGERLVLQAFVNLEGEAGVFWVRQPGEAHGQIVSLTLKCFPYVIGDGVSTVEQLIRADPRSGQLAHLYLGRHSGRAPAAGLCRKLPPRCDLPRRDGAGDPYRTRIVETSCSKENEKSDARRKRPPPGPQ